MRKVIACYSSLLRQIRGVRQEHLTLPDGTTAADLMAILSEKYEKLAPLLNIALYSNNREVVFADGKIHDGDEVRIFPAISGGSG
jgi:molybdopterin converting factor small subunit